MPKTFEFGYGYSIAYGRKTNNRNKKPKIISPKVDSLESGTKTKRKLFER